SQVSFFACPATGQVSWDPPVGIFVLPHSKNGQLWEISDKSRGGIPYHTKSGETVWEKPDGFVIPLTVLQVCALSLSVYHTNFNPTGRIEHCAGSSCLQVVLFDNGSEPASPCSWAAAVPRGSPSAFI
ncbi:hypothetical protein EDB85DRAFT_1876178, partial [Lactarius pseudohatsudake]